MQYMHFRDNSSLSIGIIRVYTDISSLYGYFEFIGIFRVVYHRIEITVSHVTHLIFRFRVHSHTRMSGTELWTVLHTFFTLTQQKKLLMLDDAPFDVVFTLPYLTLPYLTIARE